jgi:hypothetical protein
MASGLRQPPQARPWTKGSVTVREGVQNWRLFRSPEYGFVVEISLLGDKKDLGQLLEFGRRWRIQSGVVG